MMKLAASLTIAVICATLFAATESADEALPYSCQSLEIWSPTDIFRCGIGNDVCTQKRFECDSIKDCPDFSDEDHCSRQHAANCFDDFFNKKTSTGDDLQNFQCDDGMCILGCYRCDNFQDCRDASDEIGCTGNEIIPPCY